MRKAPSPRRRWRREVLFCMYDGKSSMRSPRLRGCWPRFTGGAARGLHCRTRHPSPRSHRCGCSISADVRIKSAAPSRRELCAKAAKLQWLAPTLPSTVACTPRRPKREMRDNSVLTLGAGPRSPRNVLRGRYPTLHRAASLISDFRPTASAVIPRHRARLPRRKTQYKCG